MEIRHSHIYSNVLSGAFPYLGYNSWFYFGQFSVLTGLCSEMACAKFVKRSGMEKPADRLA